MKNGFSNKNQIITFFISIPSGGTADFSTKHAARHLFEDCSGLKILKNIQAGIYIKTKYRNNLTKLYL